MAHPGDLTDLTKVRFPRLPIVASDGRDLRWGETHDSDRSEKNFAQSFGSRAVGVAVGAAEPDRLLALVSYITGLMGNSLSLETLVKKKHQL